MSLADITLEHEKSHLSEFAFLTQNTKGRKISLAPDGVRTDFQRDRDRIIHSKSFRRLMHKTQVFLAPEGDHYRTRLTHTLEVTQIGRTIARAPRLNEDLTEACCMGHDLGHTPFGHTGETVLNGLLKGGFRHNEHSLRMVERLENSQKGLNLTAEVREGILCHTGDQPASTLEGRIVRYADRIAYVNHDIDDAMRAGILNEEIIPQHLRNVLGRSCGERIDTMVQSVIKASAGRNTIEMTEREGTATDELRDFMFASVYTAKSAKAEEDKAKNMLEMLYLHFIKYYNELPSEYAAIMHHEGIDRAVCDFIAGMTDRYAISLFNKIFVPETWHIL